MTEPNWSEVFGIYGGSFDPPHLGHLEAATAVIEDLKIRKLIIVPSGRPPLKLAGTDKELRLEMVRSCFSSTKISAARIEIDTREIERESVNPSYTFDTIQEMKQEFHSPLAFIIGSDQLLDLNKWHRFQDLLKLCHWIVLKRKPIPETQVSRVLEQLAASGILRGSSDHQFGAYQITGSSTHLRVIETPAPELSSSQIRAEIQRRGEIPRNVVTEKVADLIRKNGLYGMKRPQYDD